MPFHFEGIGRVITVPVVVIDRNSLLFVVDFSPERHHAFCSTAVDLNVVDAKKKDLTPL